jgi:hypothetical protein
MLPPTGKFLKKALILRCFFEQGIIPVFSASKKCNGMGENVVKPIILDAVE